MSVYESVLADLCARFVINSPQESFQSWERLLFEVTSTSNSGLIDLFAANTAAGGARMVVLYRFSYSAAPKAGGMRRRALPCRWSFSHNRNTQLHKNTLKEFTRGLFAQVREHHSCRESYSLTRSASCWLRMCTMLMPYTPPFSSTRRSHLERCILHSRLTFQLQTDGAHIRMRSHRSHAFFCSSGKRIRPQ